MDTVASRSNWCSNVVPLLVVLSSPPEAVAIQYVVGSLGLTANATIRPPIDAGPMHRQESDLVHSAGRLVRCDGFGAGAGAFFSASSFFCSSAICCSIAEISSSRRGSFEAPGEGSSVRPTTARPSHAANAKGRKGVTGASRRGERRRNRILPDGPLAGRTSCASGPSCDPSEIQRVFQPRAVAPGQGQPSWAGTFRTSHPNRKPGLRLMLEWRYEEERRHD